MAIIFVSWILFNVVNKYFFFNSHDDLKFLIFPLNRQEIKFLLNLCYNKLL